MDIGSGPEQRSRPSLILWPISNNVGNFNNNNNMFSPNHHSSQNSMNLPPYNPISNHHGNNIHQLLTNGISGDSSSSGRNGEDMHQNESSTSSNSNFVNFGINQNQQKSMSSISNNGSHGHLSNGNLNNNSPHLDVAINNSQISNHHHDDFGNNINPFAAMAKHVVEQNASTTGNSMSTTGNSMSTNGNNNTRNLFFPSGLNGCSQDINLNTGSNLLSASMLGDAVGSLPNCLSSNSTTSSTTVTSCAVTPNRSSGTADSSNISNSDSLSKPRNNFTNSLDGNTSSQLGQNSYSHNAAKAYKCKMCHHVCYSKADLSTHNTTSHNQDPRPHRCEQCGRQFSTCAYLSQHRRIHMGVKPYACQYCERRFTQLSHQQQHERIHTGQKPYKCPTCSKCFTQMSNLQSHQRQHMKGKPHRCEHCFMCFDLRDELEEHVQAKHSGNRYAKVLVCPMCSKSYNSETYLAKHLDRHKEAMLNGTPFPNPTGRLPRTLSSSNSVVHGNGLDHMNSMLVGTSSSQHSMSGFDSYNSMRNNPPFIPLSTSLPSSSLLNTNSLSNNSNTGDLSMNNTGIKHEPSENGQSLMSSSAHLSNGNLDLGGNQNRSSISNAQINNTGYDLNQHFQTHINQSNSSNDANSQHQQMNSHGNDLITSFDSNNSAISRERLAALTKVAVAFNNSQRKIIKPEPIIDSNNSSSSSHSFSRSLDFILQQAGSNRGRLIIEDNQMADFLSPGPLASVNSTVESSLHLGHTNQDGDYMGSFDALLRKAAQFNQGQTANVQLNSFVNYSLNRKYGAFGQNETEKKALGENDFEETRERNSLTA